MHVKVGAEQLQQVHHCTTQTGGSHCGPEGQRSAPSGSRRAATGVRNNRRVCSETVEDHDRRFWYGWPLTWRSSHAFTVLNTTQFHVRRPCADLARRKPGVQIPSPPPHNPAGQSVVGASSAALLSSPEAPGATLGPRPGRRGKGADRLQVDVWTTNERLQHYYLKQGFTYVRTVVLPHNPSGALFQRPAQRVPTPHLQEVESLTG